MFSEEDVFISKVPLQSPDLKSGGLNEGLNEGQQKLIQIIQECEGIKGKDISIRLNIPIDTIMNKEQFSVLYNRFKSSGLTISDFSANEGYHKSSFYYWNKKYLQATATGVIKSGTTSHFGAGQKMIIEIKHPNGLEIRLRGDIDPTVLGTILNQFQ